jgi:octaprenyl-diphosphate synthase
LAATYDMAINLEHLYPSLSRHLAAVEEELAGMTAAHLPLLHQAGNHVISGRGKRLRPVLLLLAAEAADGITSRAILYAAIVEALHTASLVHDDIIDGGTSRRGRQSAVTLWGNKVSLLLGDYIFARTFTRIAEDGDSALQGAISRVAEEMCQGQVAEIASAGADLTEETYFSIVSAKTASLFGLAARLGAAIGQAGEETIGAFESYGRHFGAAFQVADDILDLVGSEDRSGKPVAKDLKEGKITLPLIYALQACPSARPRLDEILTATSVSEADCAEARQLAESTGATARAWAVVGRFLEQARGQLRDLPDSPALQALLKVTAEAFPLPLMA